MIDPKKEQRRLQLNKSLESNERLRMKMTKRQFRNYKKFTKLVNANLIKQMEIYSNHLDEVGEENASTELFDILNNRFKQFARHKLFKFKYEDTKFRKSILASFEEQIEIILKKGKEKPNN